MYEHLCRFIRKELSDLDRRAASNGELNMQEVQYVDLLSHELKSLLTADAMEHPEEYGYKDDHSGSYERGRSRDSMGRYADTGMIKELHELMEKAPNEEMKHKYKGFIEDIQNMM